MIKSGKYKDNILWQQLNEELYLLPQVPNSPTVFGKCAKAGHIVLWVCKGIPVYGQTISKDKVIINNRLYDSKEAFYIANTLSKS